MTMPTYTVTGTLRLDRGSTPFTRAVEAGSEQHAEDKVLSQLTSEHSISRANIAIADIAEA